MYKQAIVYCFMLCHSHKTRDFWTKFHAKMFVSKSGFIVLAKISILLNMQGRKKILVVVKDRM